MSAPSHQRFNELLDIKEVRTLSSEESRELESIVEKLNIEEEQELKQYIGEKQLKQIEEGGADDFLYVKVDALFTGIKTRLESKINITPQEREVLESLNDYLTRTKSPN